MALSGLFYKESTVALYSSTTVPVTGFFYTAFTVTLSGCSTQITVALSELFCTEFTVSDIPSCESASLFDKFYGGIHSVAEKAYNNP